MFTQWSPRVNHPQCTSGGGKVDARAEPTRGSSLQATRTVRLRVAATAEWDRAVALYSAPLFLDRVFEARKTRLPTRARRKMSRGPTKTG